MDIKTPINKFLEWATEQKAKKEPLV